MPIPVPVELDRCTPAVVGGLLSGACPLPDEWQRGVSFQDTACLNPTVMGECPTCPDLKPTQEASTETFRPVSLIAAIRCSTMGGADIRQVASQTLDETASFALARELLTGRASVRDAKQNVEGRIGNPSLECDATPVDGTFQDAYAALACLERTLMENTGGRRGFILLPPELLPWLTNAIVGQPGRWVTYAGNRIIVDAGFDGRPPLCDPMPECIAWDDPTGAPGAGDQLWMYATAGLWAGIGTPQMVADVNRSNNTAEARAEQIGLAAFSTCATFAVPSTVTKTC